ncbi:hypothetical protein DPMN_056078 [Dreissena polymorpha]|uniref:Uncharacterized protein n=1 Tax=Dreissena polymorpha TaxID=45954 RepID=A0A9D4CR27_DREPO|nr:hypothetical protein DPMN_056078 [Dreissena polymorpha]
MDCLLNPQLNNRYFLFMPWKNLPGELRDCNGYCMDILPKIVCWRHDDTGISELYSKGWVADNCRMCIKVAH